MKRHEGLVEVVVDKVEDELIQAATGPARGPGRQQGLRPLLSPREGQRTEGVSHGLSRSRVTLPKSLSLGSAPGASQGHPAGQQWLCPRKPAPLS